MGQRSANTPNLNDLDALPFDIFYFQGKSETVSARVANALRRDIYGDLLAPLISDETAIFDLGSGWGRYATYFAERFPGTSVHAGELSEAGRSVTKTISDAFGLSIQSFPFNYLEWENLPDAIAKSGASKCVVFSNHSIEQVTYVSAGMYERILDIGLPVEFVHVEPVGWQLENPGRPVLNTPPSGARHGYNRNLLAVIDHLNNGGRIADLRVEPDFVAFGNITNAGTLIRFRSA